MLNAKISKENKQQLISATGNVTELTNDLAVLVNGIYTQLKNANPTAAQLFKVSVVNMLQDGLVWGDMGNQTGIVFPRPGEHEEERQ